MRSKKIILLFIIFVFTDNVFSQLLSENFDGAAQGINNCPNILFSGNPWDCAGCPTLTGDGGTPTGNTESPWYVDTSGDSCTTSGCMIFHYTPVCNGDFVLNMGPPPIPVSGVPAVRVSYKAWLQTWNSDAASLVETNGLRVMATANPEAGPEAIWDTTLAVELSPTAGLPTFPAAQTFVITTPGDQVKVVWQAYGTSNWDIDYWIIDDIVIEEIAAPQFVLNSSSVQPNNEFALINFDQEVYANVDGTGGLEPSDFGVGIQNNINNIEVTITSVVNVSDGALTGGETSIKIGLSFSSPPSGVEKIVINPAANSIYNGYGAFMNWILSTITLDLNDTRAPSVLINTTLPDDNNNRINPSGALFRLEFSEPTRKSGGAALDAASVNSNISIVYKHNNSNINFSSNIQSETIVDLDPIDMVEWDSVLVNISSFIEDTLQNVMPEFSQSFKVQDTTFATIVDSSISNDNIYFYFTASEGLFSLANESGDLISDDFNVIFSQNIGGNASSASINSVRDPSGNALNSTGANPDSSFRLTISLDDVAAGVELLTIKPQVDDIYDRGGNKLDASLVLGSFTLFDKLAPSVTFTPVDGYDRLFPDDNIFIDFSEEIRFENDDPVTNESLAGLFTLLYTDSVPSVSIPYNVTITDNKKIKIDPISGLNELANISLSFNSNIFEDASNNILASSFTVEYTVKDTTPPVLDSASIAPANVYILFNISEGVFANDDGTGALLPEDFVVSITTNVGGNAELVNIVSVSNADGLLLVGGESVIRLGLSFDNPPSGAEQITIQPAVQSIFDQSGNELDASSSVEFFPLYDILGPSVEDISADYPPASGVILPYAKFEVNYDEAVKNSEGNVPSSTELRSRTTLTYLDGDLGVIEFSDPSIDNLNKKITIDPISDMDEWRLVKITFSSGLQDVSGNVAGGASDTFLIDDLTGPDIINDSLDPTNMKIFLIASEGLYTQSEEYLSESFTTVQGINGLAVNDFAISSFYSNGGTSGIPTITSVNAFSGVPLFGGETGIRVSISTPYPASGSETFVISPKVNQVFDQAVIPLDSASNRKTIKLYDLLGPRLTLTTDPITVAETICDFESNFIFPPSTFIITFSEEVRTMDNNIPSVSDIENIVTLTYQDGGQETIQYSASIDASNKVITIDPFGPTDTALDDWRQVKIVVETLKDTVGNISDDATILYRTYDINAPDIQSSYLDSNNIAVFLTISEGLYTNLCESGGLVAEDFNITGFNENGGNSGIPVITSVTNFFGVPLSGGENEIRVNITTPNPASGSETFNIVPVDSQIFDQGRNILLPGDNTQSFTFNDLLVPEVTFNPASDSLIYPPQTFIITFNEPIVKIDESGVTSEIIDGNLDQMIQLKYTTPTSGNIVFDATINEIKTVITVDPLNDLDQQRSLTISFGNSFADTAGNIINSNVSNYTVRDVTAPAFTTDSLQKDNTHIQITMTESVYTNINATGGLEITDFDLFFNRNGGTADSVIIASVTNTSGTELIGGEDVIQLNLLMVGSPDGNETIRVNAASNAIFDRSGNVMNTTEETTICTLTAAPVVELIAISSENKFLQLNFNQNVYGNHDQTDSISVQDFFLEFDDNDGNAKTMTLDSITNTNNNIVYVGDSVNIIRIHFTLDSVASGIEVFTLSPLDNEAIFNDDGVYMDSATVLGPIRLNDLLKPTYTINIEDGANNIKNDTSIVVTFSEPVQKKIDHSSLNNLNINDLFELVNETTSENVPFNASINSNKTIITFVPMDGDTFQVASEDQIMFKIENAFEDSVENSIESGMTIQFYILDYIPPKFNSATFSSNNSYLDVEFTDQIFSSDTGGVLYEDFDLKFEPNGGNTTVLDVISLKTLAGGNLTGGENIIRFNIELDANASGDEYIVLKPKTGSSIFDEVGNVMAPDDSIGKVYFNDVLVPTIDSVNVWQGEHVANNDTVNIFFSEPIDLNKFEYSLTSRRNPTGFTFEADTTLEKLDLFLDEWLMHLDTIDLAITSLFDTSGWSTVPISFRFLTPALGDYNEPPNDTINIEDLTVFIQAWHTKDLSKELGPVGGEFPHFILQPDAKFGIDDGIVFTQMWRWSLQRFGVLEVSGSISELPSQISINDQTLTISPPSGTRAGQVIVEFNGEDCKVVFGDLPSGNEGLFLSSADLIPGKLLFEYCHMDEKAYPIHLRLDEKYVDEPSIKVRYAFMDQEKNLVSQGDSTINFRQIPEHFKLYQNFPNPFNSSTRIRYDLPDDSDIRIDIFDISGRLIKTLIDDDYQAGTYFVDWIGNDRMNEKVSSGVYFYQIRTGNFKKSVKMILIK